MPTGVQVSVGATAGAGGGDPTLIAQYFLAGTSTRGSTTAPIIARSYSEFTDLVGTRYTGGSAHDSVRSFFAENLGIGRVVFARTVGPGATSVGSITVVDRAATPLSTLRFDAASVGPWSSGASVVVTDGVLTGTYSLRVRLTGSPDEVYTNLASPTAAVQALALSNYVRAVNLGSATAATNNNPANGTYTLTTGADDAANVTATQLTAALDRFTLDYGPGIVAIPGQPATTTLAAAIGAHATTTNRIGIVSAAAGTSVMSAVTLARTLRTATGARSLGMVYPWVILPADGEAGIRTVSPEGAYAGKRAAIIDRVGVWQPPAGDFGQLGYVSGPELALTSANVDSLVDDAIIPIITTPSPRFYGDRSLSADEITWRFLSYSDLVNAVAYDATAVMARYVGRAIDGLKGAFFAQMLTDLTGVLAPYVAGGGLVAGAADPGFLIDLSANNATTVGAGQAIADISVRPPSVAELIRIRLTKVGFVPAAAA